MNLADITELGFNNPFRERYGNFIGGRFVPPIKGKYHENVSPIIGNTFVKWPG